MTIDSTLLTASDFIGVRAALVKQLEGNAAHALVLTRIYFRADGRWREAHQHAGEWWWRASYQTIADETGLSIKQVERCISWLTTHGYMEARAFRLEGPYDQTRSYHLLVSGDDTPDSGDVDTPDSGDVPSMQKVKTLKVFGGATITEPDLVIAFDLWWKTYPRKVNKPAALKAYRVAVTKASIDDLALGAIAYRRATVETEPRFVAHPSSWLNGERWNDEVKIEGSGRDSIRSL